MTTNASVGATPPFSMALSRPSVPSRGNENHSIGSPLPYSMDLAVHGTPPPDGATVSVSAAPALHEKPTLIIPAYNEAPRIGRVLDVVRDHPRLGQILVVNNNSVDDTAAVAAREGARVIDMPLPGKGIAMAAGAASTPADILVFLDGDLVNLHATHVDQLLDPVEEHIAQMSRGLLDHGRRTVARARFGPVLTGQRAITAELFARLLPADVQNWGVEQALNTIANKYGFSMKDVVLSGLDHVNKTVKYTPWEGNKVRAKMLMNTQTARFGVIARHRGLEDGGQAAENAVQAATRVLEALKVGSSGVRELRWIV